MSRLCVKYKTGSWCYSSSSCPLLRHNRFSWIWVTGQCLAEVLEIECFNVEYQTQLPHYSQNAQGTVFAVISWPPSTGTPTCDVLRRHSIMRVVFCWVRCTCCRVLVCGIGAGWPVQVWKTILEVGKLIRFSNDRPPVKTWSFQQYSWLESTTDWSMEMECCNVD